MLCDVIYDYRIMSGLKTINFHTNLDLPKFFNISRAREALRQCLPDQLRDATFSVCLQEDKSTKHWMSLLLKNLEPGSVAPPDPRQMGMSPLPS